jgi:hypothetical protein
MRQFRLGSPPAVAQGRPALAPPRQPARRVALPRF